MNFENILKSKKTLSVVNFILLLSFVLSLGINQVVIAKTYEALGVKNGIFKTITSSIVRKSASGNVSLSGNVTEDAIALAISQGVPGIYGEELGVSFDAVEQSMNVMKQFDPTYGQQKITLAGSDLQRFIDIGLKISCEYCCGAKAIINQNGQAACGCAHSQPIL